MPPNKEAPSFEFPERRSPELPSPVDVSLVSSENSSDAEDEAIASSLASIFAQMQALGVETDERTREVNEINLNNLLPLSFPMPPELKDILINVANTENLHEVTRICLKVIAREVSLQRISVYMPQLSELILDGSAISTLRDLGCGLINLKVLKVNRCGLTSLDGLMGLDTLEELYAKDNQLENVCQCTSLEDVRILDVRNNLLTNINAIEFLTLCEKLEHLYVEGNKNVTEIPNYRKIIKRDLPSLISLDSECFPDAIARLTKLGKAIVLPDTSSEEMEEDEICEEKDKNNEKQTIIEKEQVSSTNNKCEGDNNDTGDTKTEEKNEIIKPSHSGDSLLNSMSVQEMMAINLERGVLHTQEGSLPPILNRPSSSFETRRQNQGVPLTRPSSHGQSANTRNFLPTIEPSENRRHPSSPSLTVGTPLCGNLAAALRSRSHKNEDE